MLRYLALVAALAAGCAFGIFVGGSPLAPPDVLAALLHPHATGDVALIVWTLRVPRVAIAALVGASLATSGFLLQGLLRNPLADPFVTGVSAGAAVAIAFGVATGVAAGLVPALGFAAGLATAVLVGLIARRGPGVDAERLILTGFSLSALFSAIVTLVELTHSREASDEIVAWLAGSIAGRGYGDIVATAPYSLAGVLCAIAAVPSLNAMRLGPSVARSVGVDVARTQWLALGGASLLAASAVSLAGIVGFVGLIVPHVARRVLGNDARASLLGSILIGATLVPIADALARSIVAPIEIPLGVLLAFVGVPSFLYIYLRPAGRRSWVD